MIIFDKKKQKNIINREFFKYHSMELNTKILINKIMSKLQKDT